MKTNLQSAISQVLKEESSTETLQEATSGTITIPKETLFTTVDKYFKSDGVAIDEDHGDKVTLHSSDENKLKAFMKKHKIKGVEVK